MPLLDLCSRLVVTSIRRNTLLPSFRLSPFRPPRPAPRFPSDLRPSFHASLSTATPNSRCRHLRPWVVTRLVPRLQPLPASPPRRVARCPELSPCGLCRPHTCPVRWLTSTSCRTPSPRSASRARFLGATTCFGAVHQDCTPFTGRRRLPPAGPFTPPRACAWDSAPGPPLVPRLCRHGPSFRHAFTPGFAER